jgi:hypothetical protein
MHSPLKDGVLTFEQFGAIGDGVADDTSALQACLTRAQATFLDPVIHGRPGATYRTTSTLCYPVVRDVGLTLVGNGAAFRADHADYLLRAGQEAATVGAPPIVVRGWRIYGAKGIHLKHWGTCLFEGNNFVGMSCGIVLEESYSVTVRQNRFLSFAGGGIGVTCATSAMHLLLASNGFYNVDVCIQFNAIDYNINIIENDMEGGVTAISIPFGGACFRIDGNYIEGMTSVPVFFGAAMAGLVCSGNWIGYNAGAQQWHNITSGELNGNIFANQAQAIGATASGLTVGNNAFVGSSNVIVSPYVVPALLNGFANVGSPWDTAGYRKDAHGVVRLKGMIHAGADNVAFTLPVGFRPAAQRRFASGGTTAEPGTIIVTPAGSVTAYLGLNGTVSLDPVSFEVGG